jgi:hypothetical protein
MSAFKIIAGKPTGKGPLGGPRRRWEDYTRMDLEEIGIKSIRGIGLIRLRIRIIGEPLWRRLHNEELHTLYRSANIVRVMKSRKLR